MSESEEIFPDNSRYTESFGEYLRRHREASGKTLDGISRTTRISKRYLQALEDNDHQRLPEEAFTRGFLKSYIKELGLDLEEALSRYDQFKRSLMPTQIKELKHIPRTKASDGFPSFEKQRLGLILVVIGFLGLAGWVGWRVVNWDRSTPLLESESAPTQGLVPSEVEPVGRNPDPQSQAVQPTSDTPIAAPAKPSILSITSVKGGTMNLRVDDNPAEDFSFKVGEKKEINIFKEVEIRVADRTGFQFQYNGKPLDISGPVIKLFNRNLFSKKP